MTSFAPMTSASYPFVFKADGDLQQDRVKGMVQLATGTSYQDFAQQLAQRVGLPAGQLQVVIACSRANEFDQLQKIPVHEGTNFNVILTQHNPACDKNVHFIVSPKMSAKERAAIAQRKAMEAARADEEAATRVASASNSPRYQHPGDGPSILARLARAGALNGKMAGGLLPQYGLGSPPAYNRNVVLAPHGNGWTAPGSSSQGLFKGAVAGGGNGSGLNSVVPQHMMTGRPTAGSPDENRAPLFTGVTALTGPGSLGAPRVTPFPEGMLRRVHEEHSSSGDGEGEFWRTSPRDRMVMGFRGPSPFGPIGTKIRAA